MTTIKPGIGAIPVPQQIVAKYNKAIPLVCIHRVYTHLTRTFTSDQILCRGPELSLQNRYCAYMHKFNICFEVKVLVEFSQNS